MPQEPNQFIAALVEDLRPVMPLRRGRGMVLAIAALLGGVTAILIQFPLRSDIAAGRPDAMMLMASGLFLVLALASAWSVIDMARPFVGARREGWGWSALMAGVLPVSALASFAIERLHGTPVTLDRDGIGCLQHGLLWGVFTATVLVLWLRRGAPIDRGRAGMMVGVAAGAAGIFAVSLGCAHNDLAHLGIWHGLTVALAGLLGRIAVPRLIAW